GLKGVAAMPELRLLKGTSVHIFRPLLEHARSELLAYATRHGLRWVEDESNASTLQQRNFLRHEVAPLLDERFPAWRESLARFARHAAVAGELLEALAALDGAPPRAGEPMPLARELSAER